MEFYLVKAKLSFNNRVSVTSTDSDIITFRFVRLEEPLTLGPVTNCVGELIGEYNYGGNSFGMALMTILSGWKRERTIISTRLSLDVGLTMTSKKTANLNVTTQGWLELENGPDKELLGFQIFDRLMNSALLPNSFEWNLNLKMFEIGFEADRKNFEPKLFEEKNCHGLEMTGKEITEDVWSKWNHTRDADDDDGRDVDGIKIKKNEFVGEIRLTLSLDHCAVTKLYLESLGSNDVPLWPRNLIIEGDPSDLVVLAGGEKDKDKGIKCHKKILAERYPGFTAMFQADMSESKDNCLELADMTEAGVRAMLQFIYARDLEEASKKCEIAVELLKAGHKYGMEDLQDAMMQLIWAKPVEWVSVDLALKMVLFSRNIGGKCEKIGKTGLAILKWYAKKPGSLRASEEYRKLYLENRQVAMELGESFLKI